MKTSLVLTIALFAAFSLRAEEVLIIQDGATAYELHQLRMEAQQARMEAARAAEQQKQLQKCLRETDNPYKPGPDLCYQWYGE